MAASGADSIAANWFRPTRGADGVAAAEKWAHEFFARLRPWMATERPRIEWKSVDEPPRPSGSFGAAYVLAADAVDEAVEQEGIPLDSLATGDGRLPYIVNRVVRLNRAWEIAAERKLEVLPATWPPSAVRGRRFSELANPFEPLLAIWDLGYLIEADDDGAVLMAPIATLV